MERYKKGEVYVCAEPGCGLQVVVENPCPCENCSPLSCCGRPMVKKT